MCLGYYEFTVGAQDDGITVKTFLRRRCGLSARSMTVIKYDGGSIMRDNKEVRAHDILHGGDTVKVKLPQERCEIEPVAGSLEILYEDDRLLIVDKPAYLPVHPTKNHRHDTLANIVSEYQQNRGESYTFRALNRLDKDTSGCVLIAKDRIAYTLIRPTVHKTYVAVCEGVIHEGGTVSTPIALAPDSKIKRCVREDGQAAITHYRPLRSANGHTLCELWLETGRTHQIRCHMSYIGHPLAGDDLYGGSLELIDRQALHCRSVVFTHPVTGDAIRIDTGLPIVFTDILDI